MRRISVLLSIFLFTLSAFAAKLRQVAIVDLPGRPGFESVVFANGKLVIAHKGADTLDIFDPRRRRLVAQVSEIRDPRGMAVDAATGTVYIACAGSNSIAVLNSKNWQVETMIPLRDSPEAVLAVPQSKALYVTDPFEHSISVVSTEGAGSETGRIDVGGRPEQIAWDPQKKLLYATVEDRNEIVVLDPALMTSAAGRVGARPSSRQMQTGQGQQTQGAQTANSAAADPAAMSHGQTPLSDLAAAPLAPAVVRTIKLTASEPTGLLFDANTRRLYVAVRYAVVQIDPDAGTEIARVPAPAGTDSLTMDSASNTLYASSVDGSIVILNAGDKLSETNEFQSEVRGHALAVDPANKTIFLSGGREGKSKLVILKQFGLAQVDDKTETAQNSRN